MGLIEQVQQQMRPRAEWPVGDGAITFADREYGHDDERFSPERYGDYLATSNEVFAAAMLRARAMSGLTLKLYDRDGPEREEILDGAAYRLLRHVNPHWTRRRLAMMDELAMCLWGESFWAVERDRTGRPTEIWWMKPSRVRVVPHESGYIRGFLYRPVDGSEDIPFTSDEVVWFRYPNPVDEFSALSPLAAARLAADTASSMMRSNRNLFDQGLQMGGFVTPKDDKVSFSAEQASDLERLLERRFKGVDKAHRWAVMRFEAQFQQMQVSPKDAEFVEGLSLTLRQVGNAYGVPVPLLNDLQNATLSNAREYERLLWTHALVPDAQLHAEEIVEQFLPMFRGSSRARWAEHDFSKISALQDAASEVWGRERQAIESGAMTINEWRKSKGMPPVPWGDVWWAPVNKSAVSDASSSPEGDTEGATLNDADVKKLLAVFEPPEPAVVNGSH